MAERESKLTKRDIEQIMSGQYKIVEGVGAPEFKVKKPTGEEKKETTTKSGN